MKVGEFPIELKVSEDSMEKLVRSIKLTNDAMAKMHAAILATYQGALAVPPIILDRQDGWYVTSDDPADPPDAVSIPDEVPTVPLRRIVL